jgi:hypothetical protein
VAVGRLLKTLLVYLQPFLFYPQYKTVFKPYNVRISGEALLIKNILTFPLCQAKKPFALSIPDLIFFRPLPS